MVLFSLLSLSDLGNGKNKEGGSLLFSSLSNWANEGLLLFKGEH